MSVISDWSVPRLSLFGRQAESLYRLMNLSVHTAGIVGDHLMRRVGPGRR
jgi:hypothetical protein